MKYLITILLCALLILPVVADNTTVVTPIATVGQTPTTNETVTITPTTIATTIKPTPLPTPIPFIYQGDSVYINDTIDISGTVPPYPDLAYWNGYDMYDSNASYIYQIPNKKSAYYNFWLDPSVFSTRTGKWYKYDPDIDFEKNGNNLAFVVYPQSYKNTTMRYSNGSLFNMTQYLTGNYTEENTPISPPVSIKHISDYVVATGDPFSISINETTRLWLFGRVDSILSYQSINSTHLNMTSDALDGFEPGSYTLAMQTVGNISKNFTVQYDSNKNVIQWFDPISFKINTISTLGYSPRVFFDKLKELIPETYDKFTIYNLTLQPPSVEITSISEVGNIPNQTVNLAGETIYNSNVSALQVIGYTNLAIGDKITFVLDEDKQTARTLKKFSYSAVASGTNNPGDMRWFDVIIPLDKYNLALGDHTITAHTNLSTGTTSVTFNIYSAPEGTYIPQKTIRYVSGQYGEQEFVPTPTPETIIKTVTVAVPGPTQIIIQKVTPEPEVVRAQQEQVIGNLVTEIIIGIIIIGIIIYGVSLV